MAIPLYVDTSLMMVEESDSEDANEGPQLSFNVGDHLPAPDPIWIEIYPLQDMAFQKIQKSGESTLRVFSFEKESPHSRGARRYIVASYAKFWKWYSTLQKDRHYYELVREKFPAKLYFDVEFEPLVNPQVDGIAALRLFLDYLFRSLGETFGIRRARRTIIDLSSTSASKFSHHLFVTNCIFANNVEMGYYVKHFVLQLYVQLKQEHDALRSQSTPQSVTHFEMLFPLNSDGQRKPIIDTAVYTKNRNFRLWRSSKLGKTSEFHVGELDELFSTTDEADYFYNSLICHIPYPYNTLPQLRFEERAKELHATMRANPTNVPSVQVPASLQIKLPRMTRQNLGPVSSGDVTFGNQSPLPELDSFIAQEMHAWPGHTRPVLRGWRLLEDSAIMTYNIGSNRYCERIKREHKSNHIFIVCNLRKRVWFQSCHDPECQAIRYESPHKPIPWIVDTPGYDAFEDLDQSISTSDFDPDAIVRTASSIPISHSDTMDTDFPVHDWEQDFDPDSFLQRPAS